MAELALGVVGVLPVLLEALKTYRSLSEKISIACHWCSELRWIEHRLQIQKLLFFYNCERLIRYKLRPDEDLGDIIDLSKHQFWHDESTNDRMREALGRTVDSLLQQLVTEIQHALEEFQDDLQCYEKSRSEKAEVSSPVSEISEMHHDTDLTKHEALKDTFRRVRLSCAGAIEKPRFLKKLEYLKDHNETLRNLIEGSIDWTRHEKRRGSISPDTVAESVVENYSSVGQAAAKLHEALSEVWCCNGLGHTDHYAKLCIKAQHGRGVRLDLAISYGKGHPQGFDSAVAEDLPTWLYIQSSSTEVETSMASQKRKQKFDDTSDDEGGGRATEHNNRARRDYIRSATNISPTSETEPRPAGCVVDTHTEMVDLCQSDNVCGHLTLSASPAPEDRSSKCLGYLETRNQFKHLFYCPGPEESFALNCATTLSQRFFSLNDVIASTNNATLDPCYKLQLAVDLTKAVLRFHQTPWLRKQWQLEDFAFFDQKMNLPDIRLETLHLTSRLTDCKIKPLLGPSTSDEADMHTSTGLSNAEDMAFDKGVRNLVLFHLGVALLQIACWKPFSALRDGHSEDDIYVARKISASRQAVVLGPVYKHIVQKCLGCDFNCGTDLARHELEAAVSTQIIPSLESMIEAMKI